MLSSNGKITHKKCNLKKLVSVYFERLKTSCIVRSVVRLMLANVDKAKVENEKIDNGKVEKAKVNKGVDNN